MHSAAAAGEQAHPLTLPAPTPHCCLWRHEPTCSPGKLQAQQGALTACTNGVQLELYSTSFPHSHPHCCQAVQLAGGACTHLQPGGSAAAAGCCSAAPARLPSADPPPEPCSRPVPKGPPASCEWGWCSAAAAVTRLPDGSACPPAGQLKLRHALQDSQMASMMQVVLAGTRLEGRLLRATTARGQDCEVDVSVRQNGLPATLACPQAAAKAQSLMSHPAAVQPDALPV